MTQDQEEIQDRIIRGITPKIIAWLIGCTATIIMSLAGGIWVVAVWKTHLEDRVTNTEKVGTDNTIQNNAQELHLNALDVEVTKLKYKK